MTSPLIQTNCRSLLVTLHQILNDNEITASIFSHAPQGLIHVRPFLNLSDEKDLQRMHRLANQLFENVVEIGGTISGSQGDGLSRTWYLKRQYGKFLNVFSDVKNVFDPQNVLNPGKIVGQPFSRLTDNVRPISICRPNLFFSPLKPQMELRRRDGSEQEAIGEYCSRKHDQSFSLPILAAQLNWVLPEIALAARNCNGCGRCRTTIPRERMCPVISVGTA